MEKPRRRVRALGLHWVALVSLTAGALASGACSDDATTGTKTPAGGEGGEPGAAGGAAGGGPGGGPAVAGSAQQAGAGGQSEGGAGGVPEGPTAGEQCAACGATECGDELDSCAANQECAPWLTCITACDDEACIDTCDEMHADVARVYYGIYDCLCGGCEDECAAGKTCDKQCVPDDVLPPTDTAPATLAETGLYAGYVLGEGGAGGAPALDPATEPLTPTDYVHLFEPKYPLWADGAEKERYIYIPKCSTIDTSDQDHWEFPVGTRIWKLFTVPTGSAGGGTRVETRMLHHYGPGEIDWLYAAYQWDVASPDDPAAALLVGNAGVTSANNTTHDIPSVDQCQNCHAKLSERVLGFSAFQLSHPSNAEDLTIEKASNLGWFSDPAPEGFEVPGTPVQQAALGYLHGNCGGCHAQGQALGAGTPNGNKPLVMRLAVGQTDYADTDTVTSSVGILVGSAMGAIAGKPRIDPMAPDSSAIFLRMNARGIQLQMPPLETTSTKVADTAGGVADVTAWINSIQ